MPRAARIHDPTGHPGLISSPGMPTTVTINGQLAAAVGDVHICAFPPPAGPHPPSTIVTGSTTVTIGGRRAARVGDIAGCGAVIILGAANVSIGG